MTIRRLTDPERFRTTYYGARRYIDPLAPDDRWQPTGDKERLVNCTSIAKEVGSQSFFKKVGDSRVPLDALRVADYALDAWDRLAEMPADERRHALATSATRDLQRAADRGTAVHALIEALLRGETPMLLEAEADQYLDVAEQVAKEFDGIFTHQEVVAFSRGNDHTDYAGTFDAWHTDGKTLADWKTRGPDSQHGCYEKEVAQLGMAALTDYWITEANGEPTRMPTPTFESMMVVSIRPDSFEVFDVDPELAVEVARHALAIHDHRRSGASTARSATSTPRHSPSPSPEVPSSQSSGDPSAPSSAPNTAGAPGPTPSTTEAEQRQTLRRRRDELCPARTLSRQLATNWAPGPFDGTEQSFMAHGACLWLAHAAAQDEDPPDAARALLGIIGVGIGDRPIGDILAGLTIVETQRLIHNCRIAAA